MPFSWGLESKRKRNQKFSAQILNHVNSENFSSLSSFSNQEIFNSIRFGYWKYLYNHIESNSPYYWTLSSNQNRHSYTGQGWYHLDKNRRQKINCFGPLQSVLQYIDNPGNTLYLCMAHSNLLHQNCSFYCWSSLGKNRLRPMDLWFPHLVYCSCKYTQSNALYSRKVRSSLLHQSHNVSYWCSRGSTHRLPE